MSKRKCALCLSEVNSEDAPILTMGAFGNPKYLCEECAELFDAATLGTDYEEITSAMNELTSRISKSNVDDQVVVDAITATFVDAAARANLIKEGRYDFSLDEVEEEMVEIPEELRESEEDRALDEKEAEEAKKADKVMNWVWLGVLVAAIAFIIWRFFF